jgi:hypothetical protein
MPMGYDGRIDPVLTVLSYALPYYAIRTELTPARLAKLEEKVPPCETE